MSTRSDYKTKQRETILNYLKSNSEKHITADAIKAYLRENGEDVGLTTIYRNLDRLAKEGVILKYDLPESLSACYQYIESCPDNPHFHAICVVCGNVAHIECMRLRKLSEHFNDKHGFQLDQLRTVFYGKCRSCVK